MEILITVIAVILLHLIIVNTLISFGDYKYYKKVFKELDVKEYYRLGDIICSTDGQVGYFTSTQDVKLKEDVYLHNSWFTYFSPYSLYWLIKYQRYFKNKFDL